MVSITDIGGALSSLKAAKDIAEAMVGLRDAAAFQEKRIELQSKILDAQERMLAAQDERTALVERTRALEREVARFKAWDAEKQRYELKRWGHGAFAYVLKGSEAGGEPIHALCTACYDRGVKSRLQANGDPVVSRHAWDCPTCKFSLKAGRNALQNPAAG
jgi:hypothetical protein